MDMIINIIAFIVALSVIISIHELGHFIFAKKAGILCYDFSLGMGPVLWKKQVGETAYGIRAVPIGGFVSMAGEEITLNQFAIGDTIGLNFIDGKVSEIVLNNAKVSEIEGEVFAYELYSKNGEELFIDIATLDGRQIFLVIRNALYIISDKKELQIAPYDRCFESKTMLQRFLTIVFGPVMNFLLAILIFIIVSFFVGFPVYESSTIGEVSSQATNIVLKGDTIKAINGETINNWNDIGVVMNNNLGVRDVIDLTVERDGGLVDLTVNPMFYLGNIGVYGKYDVDGVKVNVYTNKASEAGLEDGDIITSIDGVAINSWNDLVAFALALENDTVAITYTRGGIANTANVQVLSKETLDVVGIDIATMKIGIAPQMKFSFFRSLGAGFTNSYGVVENIFGTLGLLFGGSNDVGVQDLSGPVGIYTLISSSLSGGFLNYIAFIAFLSVNIGLLNLFPIPGLDGGRIVFLGYELITRRKMNKKVENTINTFMVGLLMVFLLFVTFNDILRLFR